MAIGEAVLSRSTLPKNNTSCTTMTATREWVNLAFRRFLRCDSEMIQEKVEKQMIEVITNQPPTKLPESIRGWTEGMIGEITGKVSQRACAGLNDLLYCPSHILPKMAEKPQSCKIQKKSLCRDGDAFDGAPLGSVKKMTSEVCKK